LDIFSCFTKDNITFFLAVIGSLGTLYTLINKIVYDRVKLDIKIISGQVLGNKCYLCYVTIINGSTLPISISGISLIGKERFDARVIPETVHVKVSRSGNEITSRQEDFSIAIPISLAPLQGTSGYLYFPLVERDIEKSFSNSLSLEVVTNRNKVVKIELTRDKVPPLRNK
jgi:hypothetical protein